MLYLLITTCLIPRNFEERKRRYMNGITTAIRRFSSLAKIIILENNGKRSTFLDEFGVEVFYTDNNQLSTPNIGNKELADLRDCISHYKIQEEDFVVKLSGRYILQEQCEFLDALMIALFEKYLRTEDRAPFKQIMEEALPVLDKVEKEGGRIDMSIKHYDSSKIQSGSCLFSDDPRGYFSFLDEFLDGFDDFADYKVMKMGMDEKRAKEAKEAEWDELRRRIRAKEPPKNEVILAESESLPNQEPAEIKTILIRENVGSIADPENDLHGLLPDSDGLHGSHRD